MNLSVADKLAIAALLDELGVDYVEGGWPGAVPKDTEFFARAAKELDLSHARLAAFGSTCRAGAQPDEDPQVRALVDSEAGVITLVAKSDIRHVERALRTDGQENLRMISATVRHLVGLGREVVVDAEHFFDGYGFDPEYALSCVRAAFEAGAATVVLCDTNGGMLPDVVARVVTDVRARTTGRLGMHAHNDSGCAVANTLAAVAAGAGHVQGTINGYGERTGNADLVTCAANLELKQSAVTLPGLGDASRIAHAVSEITNIPPYTRQPYVGSSAFAHKAGLHASAIRVDPDLYQHIDPVTVGNDMRMLISEMAGRASIELKGRELGFDLSGQADLLARVTNRVKAAEADGYTYDAADASFELLLRSELDGGGPHFFDVESWRAFVEHRPSGNGADTIDAEATVKLRTGQGRMISTGEGNGPVNALDHALRGALVGTYPEIEDFELIDYRVRILDSQQGTDATIRVLIDTSDGVQRWSTVGVGTNIIEASWEALTESITWGLLHHGVEPR
ncbi:citramalate synthase [Georgenia halophila]